MMGRFTFMETTKPNQDQPHLHIEGVMVDLLHKKSVNKTDVPECYHERWDAFFKLKPQNVGGALFHEFYNYVYES